MDVEPAADLAFNRQAVGETAYQIEFVRRHQLVELCVQRLRLGMIGPRQRVTSRYPPGIVGSPAAAAPAQGTGAT